jgi:hypothetical protein
VKENFNTMASKNHFPLLYGYGFKFKLVANPCDAQETIKLLKIKYKEIMSSFSSLIGYVLFIYLLLLLFVVGNHHVNIF